MPVYRDKADYQRFLEGMYIFNTSRSVNLKDIHRKITRSPTSARKAKMHLFDVDRRDTLVDIGAYCLMPNHFHILIREKDAKGKGVSKFMQKLMTAYTMYYNKKRARTGALFGSSYKARHVVDDVHLKYLFAYIHLNPAELVARGQLEKYAYSSYSDYLDIKRKQRAIINPHAFPNYFSPDEMKDEVEEWLLHDVPEV